MASQDRVLLNLMVEEGCWKRPGCVCRIKDDGAIQSCGKHGSADRDAAAQAIMDDARAWAKRVLGLTDAKEVTSDGA